jgi:hypothetical protein
MPRDSHLSATVLLRLALVLATLSSGCGEWGGSTLVLAREEHLERQVASLRALVARAKNRTLVPRDGVVVAVGEGLARELIQLALPREVVLHESLRVRLETVDVGFRDGLGTVRLEGRAEWKDVPGFPGTDASADLTVYGRVDRVAVDPRAGRLEGAVVPFGFEIHRLEVGEERPNTRRLAATLARTLEEELPQLSMPLVVPIAVEQQVRFAALRLGAVHVRGASAPLRAVVRDVSAHGGRLWLVLRISPGPWTPSADEPRQ